MKLRGGIHLHADHELPGAQLAQQFGRLLLAGDAVVALGHDRQFFDCCHGRRLDAAPGQVLVQRRAHGADVHGRGAAAAAQQAGAVVQEAARLAGEVFRAGWVIEAPFHPLRETGVGHDAHAEFGRVGVERLQRAQHGRRADGAVHAHQVGPGSLKLRRSHVRRDAVVGQAVLGKGKRGDDGQVAHLARHLHGERQLVQFDKGLEEQQIGAGFPQHADLFAEGLARLLLGEMPVRHEALAQRTDIAGDEDGATAHLAHIAHQLHGAEIEVAHLVGQAIGGQAHPVGAEGVRLDHVGAGVGVGEVDFADRGRSRQHKILKTLFAARALRIKHGAHGAVGEKGRCGQALKKWMSAHSILFRHTVSSKDDAV